MSEDLNLKFQRVIEIWEAHKDEERIPFSPVWGLMHDLAERQHEAALQFFIDGLEQEDWSWRQEFLRFVGFHYQLDPEGRVVKKIRELLMSDPSSEVRSTAAAVLGSRSRWPDQALLDTLENDPDSEVQTVAFDALLRLRGLSVLEANDQLKNVLKRGERLNREQLERCVAETNNT